MAPWHSARTPDAQLANAWALRSMFGVAAVPRAFQDHHGIGLPSRKRQSYPVGGRGEGAVVPHKVAQLPPIIRATPAAQALGPWGEGVKM